jgi:hypothetical protein
MKKIALVVLAASIIITKVNPRLGRGDSQWFDRVMR